MCELIWYHGRERMDIRAVWNVIMEYERTRNSLSKMDVDDTVAYLDVITHASTNVRNRHLDMILEREKARVIQDIITDLRKKTGDDLSSDPEAWVKKYHLHRN